MQDRNWVPMVSSSTLHAYIAASNVWRFHRRHFDPKQVRRVVSCGPAHTVDVWWGIAYTSVCTCVYPLYTLCECVQMKRLVGTTG